MALVAPPQGASSAARSPIVACYSGSEARRLGAVLPPCRDRTVPASGPARMEIIGSTFRDGSGCLLGVPRPHRRPGATLLRSPPRLAATPARGRPLVGPRGGEFAFAEGAAGSARCANHLAARVAMVRDSRPDAVSPRRTCPPTSRTYLPLDERRYSTQSVEPQVQAGESAGWWWPAPTRSFRFFDQIDAFHLERWKAPQYVGVAREFHFALARALIARVLRMSTLFSAGAPLAVMYNVRLGTTEYNIQSGFDPALAVGLSPGYLHFGYSLEEACRDGIRRFDFLAGEGRNRQYKQDFVTTEFPLLTFHAIRARHLKLLYRAHGRFIRWFGK